MSWSKSYTVNFAVDGDTTSEAIEKHINELTAVYALLNRLRGLDNSSTAPSDPETDALWFDTSGTDAILKSYSGSAWLNILAIGTIEGLTANLSAKDTQIGLRVLTSEIIDTVVSSDSSVPLSANMGKFLKDTIDNLTLGIVETDYATSSVGGTVKIGDRLSISSGVLSVVIGNDYITTAMIQDEAVTPSKLTNYSIGTLLVAKADAIKTVTSTSYIKVKEIYVPREGTITIKFDLIGDSSYGGTTYGRIYINGSASGTERSTSVHTSYTTYTENISVSSGDLVQLYMKRSQSSGDGKCTNLSLFVDELYEICVINNA